MHICIICCNFAPNPRRGKCLSYGWSIIFNNVKTFIDVVRGSQELRNFLIHQPKQQPMNVHGYVYLCAHIRTPYAHIRRGLRLLLTLVTGIAKTLGSVRTDGLHAFFLCVYVLCHNHKPNDQILNGQILNGQMVNDQMVNDQMVNDLFFDILDLPLADNRTQALR